MAIASGIEANDRIRIPALTGTANALTCAANVGRAGSYPLFADSLPELEINAGKYQLRFARTSAELDAVLRLRFEVFNLELAEGLDASYATGRDEDEFDATSHHLLVMDRAGAEVVGTYRLRTAEMAASGGGFYSAGEYRLDDFPAQVRAESIEIGRACIARAHRRTAVLFLLWQGLAMYARHNRKRYLFGCCSLTSQNEAGGWRVFRTLEERGHLHPAVRAGAVPECVCREADYADVTSETKIPRLFDTYLRCGAKVCSEPAIDRAFKTIDFLVIFDTLKMSARTRQLLSARGR
jgi:putative hemolysin